MARHHATAVAVRQPWLPARLAGIRPAPDLSTRWRRHASTRVDAREVAPVERSSQKGPKQHSKFLFFSHLRVINQAQPAMARIVKW
jgi:hypothetical protein